jgi:hypothetical protein
MRSLARAERPWPSCGVLIPRGSYCRRHEPSRVSLAVATGPGQTQPNRSEEPLILDD